MLVTFLRLFIVCWLKDILFPPASFRRAFLLGCFPFLQKQSEQSKPPRLCRSPIAAEKASSLKVVQDKRSARRILLIDDCIPDPSLGMGLARSNEILNMLVGLQSDITIFPTLIQSSEEFCGHLQDIGVKVVRRTSAIGPVFSSFLRKHKNSFDIVIISRPHNMYALYRITRRFCSSARIFYDAEAIFCLRKIKEFEIKTGASLSIRLKNKLLGREMRLAQKADTVICVSQAEKKRFTDAGAENVFVVSHCIAPLFSTTPFEARKGLLFVGRVAAGSSNEDALYYFITSIFPIIRRSIQTELMIIGEMRSECVRRLASPSIVIKGRVPDLNPFYESSKILIAPTRFAAGIPHKVGEAAAHGVPTVATPIIGEQLQWENGQEILTGDTPNTFAEKCILLLSDENLWSRIRKKAYERARNDYSRDFFHSALMKAIEPE
jgi:O-antigen biosynthesis protein